VSCVRVRARLAIAIFAVLAAAPAATAHAATVDVSGGTLRYVAGSDETSALALAPDLGAVSVAESGLAPLTAGSGCATVFPGRVRCTGVSRIVLTLGPRDDRVTSTSALPTTVSAGDGDDEILLGAGDDVLDGGPGDDLLRGGEGDDTADYANRVRDVGVSIDDRGGDGERGEDDDVRTDVENLVGGLGDDTLTGSAGANVLRGGDGSDRFIGGRGADTFIGGSGQDVADYSDRTEDLRLDDDGYADDGASGEGDNIGPDVDDLLGGSGDDAITGSSWFNTLRGGAGDDVLDGRDHDDLLDGGPGADTLRGGRGHDALEGGDGADDLEGGDGDDRLQGGRGADAFDGGSGIDTVDYSDRRAAVSVDLEDEWGAGEPGEGDRLVSGVNAATGGAGGDRLSGDGGANRLTGGDGADVLDGRSGNDDLRGGGGWDIVTYASRRSGVSVSLDDGANDGQGGEGDNVRSDVEQLIGGSGADRLRGDGDRNVLQGGSGDDDLWGHGGDDLVEGGSGHDEAWGGSGNDRLDLASGNNKAWGEDGHDPLVADSGRDQLDGGPGNDGAWGNGGDDRLTGGDGDDHLDGASGNDTLEGRRGNDGLYGADGNDTLRGAEDNDRLDGARGNDRLEGGSGDDSMDAGDGSDKLTGNDGGDHLAGGPGDDQLYGGAGADALDAGDGDNKAYGEADADRIWAGGGRDHLDGGNGDDHVDGGEGDDKVYGANDQDRLNGGGGNDRVEGGNGNDGVDGGWGNDRVDGDNGDDHVAGGPGQDTLDAGSGADSLAGGDNNDALRGGDGPDVLDGGAGDDALDGGDDADRLQGGDDRDELSGRDGYDVLDGGGGPDEIDGGEGEDTVDYGARAGAVSVTNDGRADDGFNGERDNVTGSVDRIVGGNGADHLRQTQDHPTILDGGPGNDTLTGGDRADQLRGGDGNDRLTGNKGADDFDAGGGADTVSAADGIKDFIGCGDGRDSIRADRTDTRSGCEKTTWGSPTGKATPAAPPASSPTAGRLRGTKLLRGRGRFVTIPGSGGIKIDRRLLADIRYLKAKYKIAITAGYALQGHAHNGEHPIGLGLDIVPGRDGSWKHIDRLARWAEPRQNRPRAPFRWVGYNGDAGHGRGHHLHLSWSHGKTRRGRPAPWVRVLNFKGGKPTRSPGASLRPLALRSNRGKYPRVRTGLRAVPRCQGANQLKPTWKAAGKAFGIRWTVLASITQIESSFGCNMGPSSAGAIGWTQFMPGTWRMYGMDADGDGKASPYNSVDAIFSSARYLRASGAPKSYTKALYAYNHAMWYVRKVLAGAKRFR
jgi:Ca2+-binding RTX toxin-like protein